MNGNRAQATVSDTSDQYTCLLYGRYNKAKCKMPKPETRGQLYILLTKMTRYTLIWKIACGSDIRIATNAPCSIQLHIVSICPYLFGLYTYRQWFVSSLLQRSRIIEDILLNRVPAGVTIRCLSNGQTVPTLGTSIVSSTSTVSSGSARKALFSPFLRRHPFLRFCIVCSCLCLCLMLVALLAFRNGAFYLKRLACHFIIVWVRKLLRGTVFLIHRLSIYTVSLTVGWLLFGLSCWVTRLLGVIRFALLAFIWPISKRF